MNVWGGSWGVAWGVAWGMAVAPAPPQEVALMVVPYEDRTEAVASEQRGLLVPAEDRTLTVRI